MQIEAYFQGLCLPAQIYLAIAVVGALGSLFQRPGTAIMGALFGVVWSAGINMVCQSGYATAAWVLALVPSLVLGMAAIAVVAALTAVPHHQLVTTSRAGKEGIVILGPTGEQRRYQPGVDYQQMPITNARLTPAQGDYRIYTFPQHRYYQTYQTLAQSHELQKSAV